MFCCELVTKIGMNFQSKPLNEDKDVRFCFLNSAKYSNPMVLFESSQWIIVNQFTVYNFF